MNDFKLIIQFYFGIVNKAFAIILGNWFLSFNFLILVFALIVGIYLNMKGDS